MENPLKNLPYAFIVNLAASWYFRLLGSALINNVYLFRSTMDTLGKKLGVKFNDELFSYREVREAFVGVYVTLDEEFDRYLLKVVKDRHKALLYKQTLLMYFTIDEIEEPEKIIDIIKKNIKTLGILLALAEKGEKLSEILEKIKEKKASELDKSLDEIIQQLEGSSAKTKEQAGEKEKGEEKKGQNL